MIGFCDIEEGMLKCVYCLVQMSQLENHKALGDTSNTGVAFSHAPFSDYTERERCLRNGECAIMPCTIL